MSKQPQAAPPLVEIGGTINLLGHLFVVVAHQPNKDGVMVEVPGAYLGKAPKQNKRAGAAAVAPTPSTAHAPAASGPPITPAAARQRKARKSHAARGDYRRFRPQRPPDLKIVNEPWGAGQWAALIAVLALIVAGLWLWNAGAEQRKWDQIEATSRAIQQR